MLKYILTFILFFVSTTNLQASNKAYRSLPFPPTQISKEVMDEVRDINSKFTSIENKISSVETKVNNIQIQLDRIESKLESKITTSQPRSQSQSIVDDGIIYSSRTPSWGSGASSYGCVGSMTSRVFNSPTMQSKSFGSSGSMVAPETYSRTYPIVYPTTYPTYYPQETIISSQEVYTYPAQQTRISPSPQVFPENKPRTTFSPENILRFGIRSKAIRRNNSQSCPGGVCPVR